MSDQTSERARLPLVCNFFFIHRGLNSLIVKTFIVGALQVAGERGSCRCRSATILWDCIPRLTIHDKSLLLGVSVQTFFSSAFSARTTQLVMVLSHSEKPPRRKLSESRQRADARFAALVKGDVHWVQDTTKVNRPSLHLGLSEGYGVSAALHL